MKDITAIEGLITRDDVSNTTYGVSPIVEPPRFKYRYAPVHLNQVQDFILNFHKRHVGVAVRSRRLGDIQPPMDVIEFRLYQITVQLPKVVTHAHESIQVRIYHMWLPDFESLTRIWVVERPGCRPRLLLYCLLPLHEGCVQESD
jgi:hypothetical protein